MKQSKLFSTKQMAGKVRFDNSTIIRSVSDSQTEILRSVITLYAPTGFDLDPTYSKGNFYKEIPEPRIKMDIAPQMSDVIQASSTDLPLQDNTLDSIVFDPPFLALVAPPTRKTIIPARFSYFNKWPADLYDMYYHSLKEFYRVLKDKGIVVFKCQDSVDSGKQYMIHNDVINMAHSIGFYTKDLFILIAKNRVIKAMTRQFHARKFHSYFIVFKKEDKTLYWDGCDPCPVCEEENE